MLHLPITQNGNYSCKHLKWAEPEIRGSTYTVLKTGGPNFLLDLLNICISSFVEHLVLLRYFRACRFSFIVLFSGGRCQLMFVEDQPWLGFDRINLDQEFVANVLSHS